MIHIHIRKVLIIQLYQNMFKNSRKTNIHKDPKDYLFVIQRKIPRRHHMGR